MLESGLALYHPIEGATIRLACSSIVIASIKATLSMVNSELFMFMTVVDRLNSVIQSKIELASSENLFHSVISEFLETRGGGHTMQSHT